MPKKKKKKVKVKQIQSVVGAKASVQKDGKVEVVQNVVRTVKDRTRGSYKPRKKTNKKQDKKVKERDALSILREKIELEKLQALQMAQITNPVQRTQNRRSSGDINQFFNKSKNDGTASVVSDLSKEVKSLREELKKSKEPVEKTPVVEEEKPKSKFVNELETTQNEIQRQRISRGIARRDTEQSIKIQQERVERLEKEQRQEQSRTRVATRKLNTEKSAREQAQRTTEEQFKRKESLNRAEIQRQDRIERQQPNTRPVLKLSNKNPSFPPQKSLVKVPEPVPEPEPAPQRFKVGGEVEVPFSSQEELLKAYRNRKDKPRPLPKETPKESSNISFKLEEEEETTDDSDSDIEIFKKIKEQISPTSKRRKSFLEDVKSPEIEDKISKQLLKDKLLEEAQTLKVLQETGDKAYSDRLQKQLDIQTDERAVRDLLLKEARKKDFNIATEKLDDEMRRIKDEKQREKKKARDNLRRRGDADFIDKEVGEILSGAVDQNLSQRASRKADKELSQKLVSNIFGKAFSNEIITATQNIPRSSSRLVNEEEKFRDLIESDNTKSVGRKAYSQEDALRIIELRNFNNNLKDKLANAFSKYVKKNMFDTKQTISKSKKTIDEIMKRAEEDGELTGSQLVKLKLLLVKLGENLQEIVDIENRNRDRTSKTETVEERELRIRTARVERDDDLQEEAEEEEVEEVVEEEKPVKVKKVKKKETKLERIAREKSEERTRDRFEEDFDDEQVGGGK
tara:strand:+ start:12038 stop:14257 length:2220 start_codon:yes stop_codon:yes gene_type:complete